MSSKNECRGLESRAAAAEAATDMGQDYAWAKELYRRAVEKGSTLAPVRMGLMYLYGRGVEKDESKAAELFEEIRSKEALAGCYLGMLYAQGRGVEQEEERARKLFREVRGEYASLANRMERALLCNDAEAQYELGLYYLQQKEYRNDVVMAAEWFSMAEKQGHAEAMVRLADVHDAGFERYTDMSVLNDRELATNLYEKAAALGNEEAKLKMIRRYRYGIGTARDLCKAEALKRELEKGRRINGKGKSP